MDEPVSYQTGDDGSRSGVDHIYHQPVRQPPDREPGGCGRPVGVGCVMMIGVLAAVGLVWVIWGGYRLLFSS